MPTGLSATVAVLGELLLHPGGLVGLEGPVTRSAVGPGEGAVLVAGDLGAYVHPDNHVGVRAAGSLGARYTAPSGPFVDAFAGLGVLHTFLDGAVYAPSESGAPERVVDLGRPALMPKLSVGGGVRVGAVAPFLRAEVFGQVPFQRTFLPHVAAIAGVGVQL